MQSITDATTNDAGLKHGTFNFTYDGNGNLITDPTKGASGISIKYNMLNLPDTVSGSQSINYVYDATGNKLRRIRPSLTTDYIGGIQYDNGTISFIQTEEGRALPNGTAYNYEYNIKDNLGSVRATFDSATDTARVVQQDDYYPFGMDISVGTIPSPQNYYLYNGKELQDGLGQYDYGARFYDPVIGRWGVIDPLAEHNRRWSPYNYVVNNPIRFIDPDGMDYQNGIFENGIVGNTVAYMANDGGGEEKRNKKSNNKSGQGDDAHCCVTKPDATIRAKVSPQMHKPKSQSGLDFGGNATLSEYKEPVNYQDFGLPTTSQAIGENVVNWTGAIEGGFAVSSLFKAPALLSPLGLGSTGRTMANNLMEEMSMESVMANPSLGNVVMTGMKDSRWLGWSKLQYVVKSENGQQVVIHYVGKFENGILKAVDDFKFVNK